MRFLLRSVVICSLLILCLWNGSLLSAANPGNPAAPDAAAAPAPDPVPSGAALHADTTPNAVLLNLLVSKGILTSGEAASLGAANSAAGTQQLLLLLKQKGIISESDMNAMLAPTGAAGEHIVADTLSADAAFPGQTGGGQTGAAKPKEAPQGPTVVPAIAPLRVLPIDPPQREGIIPGLTLGPIKMRPYGFVKATMAYDSSDPRGDDFIVPGFLNADTGPNKNPAFHIKARATRVGSRFEIPDFSDKVTITGQIEADYEGNFSRADNRNVSTIRSNALQLRLAFGRVDWDVSPKTDLYFEAGQDWTLFGSSAMMNLFETTFFGAYWGNVYERSPQFQFGVVEKLGGSRNFKLSPTFAIMMPSEGNVPADSISCKPINAEGIPTCTLTNGLANQLGYGERQGADAGQPEYEGRVVLQFQADKAPGVVPAQLLWSGFYAHRQATVLASAVPLCPTCAGGSTFYRTAFPLGYDATSVGYGNQIAASIPTRWFTLVASGYLGADMRFFFGNQLLSNYNYTGGLSALASAPSVDGSSTVFFGTNAAGVATAAAQRPVRDYGGFVQVGLPISRWFKADPKGRNAGWQAYFEYGIDAANTADFRKAKDVGASGAGPYKSTLKGLTVFYKMNNFLTFGFEEGKYESLALPNNEGKCTTKVAGVPSCTWTDWRTEFGPVFTF